MSHAQLEKIINEAFANAANRWVAGHLTQGFQIVSQKQRPTARPGSSQRRLGSRVATPDNNDVEIFRKDHEEPS